MTNSPELKFRGGVKKPKILLVPTVHVLGRAKFLLDGIAVKKYIQKIGTVDWLALPRSYGIFTQTYAWLGTEEVRNSRCMKLVLAALTVLEGGPPVSPDWKSANWSCTNRGIQLYSP